MLSRNFGAPHLYFFAVAPRQAPKIISEGRHFQMPLTISPTERSQAANITAGTVGYFPLLLARKAEGLLVR